MPIINTVLEDMILGQGHAHVHVRDVRQVFHHLNIYIDFHGEREEGNRVDRQLEVRGLGQLVLDDASIGRSVDDVGAGPNYRGSAIPPCGWETAKPIVRVALVGFGNREAPGGRIVANGIELIVVKPGLVRFNPGSGV